MAVAFDVALLLAVFRIRVPAWVFVLVLLAQDVVFAWRLVLLWRARRADEQIDRSSINKEN